MEYMDHLWPAGLHKTVIIFNLAIARQPLVKHW